MRLAWFNIANDKVRFVVTVAGIACAVFLMIFQGSVLMGFLHAASRMIDSTDPELWVVGRGVSCFEFPAPMERRFVEMARSVSGVSSTKRICVGQVQCRKSDGNAQLVILVGADSDVGKSFPAPYLNGIAGALEPDALVVDNSNLELLNVRSSPVDVELNHHRARIVGETSGFSTFLGTPYVFASYSDAARYLHLGPEETTFILVRLTPGQQIERVKKELQSRLPNVDIWTRQEFARKAQVYWISQTGAGGAIFMGAALGFLIGLAIVSQAIYANTMENIEEYSTLKALGASRGFILRLVFTQAMIYGACGYLIGVMATVPLTQIARAAVPWVHTPLWLPTVMLPVTLAMCAAASLLSVKKALSAEPAKVFRA
jgi:putative ABC transport system permease protein